MAKKNSPATITLTAQEIPESKRKYKGHTIKWMLVLPEGVVGCFQYGATPREVVLVTEWGEKQQKDPDIQRALAELR